MTVWISLHYVCLCPYQPYSAFCWVPSSAEQPTLPENLDLERRGGDRGGRSKGKQRGVKPSPPCHTDGLLGGLPEMFHAGSPQICHSQGETVSFGPAPSCAAVFPMLWSYWRHSLELQPLGLTSNPAQAWSPASCLSSHVGSQAMANEMDLGR